MNIIIIIIIIILFIILLGIKVGWYNFSSIQMDEQFGGINYDGRVAYNDWPKYDGRPTYDLMATYSKGSNPYNEWSYN